MIHFLHVLTEAQIFSRQELKETTVSRSYKAVLQQVMEDQAQNIESISVKLKKLRQALDVLKTDLSDICLEDAKIFQELLEALLLERGILVEEFRHGKFPIVNNNNDSDDMLLGSVTVGSREASFNVRVVHEKGKVFVYYCKVHMERIFCS